MPLAVTDQPLGTVAGHVVDRDGKPLHASVQVHSSALGRVTGVPTKKDGRFEIMRLPAGTYRVRFVHGSCACEKPRPDCVS